MNNKPTIEKIEELLASEINGKEVNNWKFGIELEYGGCNNEISYDVNDENNLIETIKEDCSVAGDGTEYNLMPISFDDLKTNKKIIKALESFCYRVANKNCTLSKTAGMHIHFSWDKEFDTDDGRIFGQLLVDMSRWLYADYDRKYKLKNMIKNGLPTSRERICLNVPIEAIEWAYKDDEENKWEINMIKKLYEAFQFIYSVSNRDGTEQYGLGTGYTRGYSRHKTLELRCWRTSYDYREIIARVFIARFFLQYILRIGLYEKYGYTKELEELNSIWEIINKPENKKLKSMYEYLAYNARNKHRMGLPLHMLMNKLITYNTQYAAEIKKRSDIYEKALKKNTNAKKAKEVFETIVNFEEKGDEDESRI
jgi:hypothetical protein